MFKPKLLHEAAALREELERTKQQIAAFEAIIDELEPLMNRKEDKARLENHRAALTCLKDRATELERKCILVEEARITFKEWLLSHFWRVRHTKE